MGFAWEETAPGVVRFFPARTGWRKEIGPADHSYAGLFSSAGLYFRREVSLPRFLRAMQEALRRFEFMACRIQAEGDRLYAECALRGSGKDPYVQLEVENRAETLDAAEIGAVLPQRVDDRMARGVARELAGLPIAAFKLTTFREGFVVGYRLNHAFLDQSGIVYFFKWLSRLYSGGDGVLLKEPEMLDLEAFCAREAPAFRDVSELRRYGAARMGLRHVSDKTGLYGPPASPTPSSTVDIRFDPSALDRVRQGSARRISENDVMHGALFKMFAMDPSLAESQELRFAFACNMRKRCGLGEETLGNILNSCDISLEAGFIRRASVAELAGLNRERIAGIGGEQFKAGLGWYAQLRRLKENPRDYLPIGAGEGWSLGLSNWASFDYEGVRFDGASPAALRTLPIPAQYRMSLICFDGIEGEKASTVSVGVPSASTERVIAFGRDAGLYEGRLRGVV